MRQEREMITIHGDQNLVTLINAFSCEPKTRDDLVNPNEKLAPDRGG
jgi:hypothetical protein